jgi:NodT family efflux transporter outer membrane factor (OMF) lipoprotein
MPIHCTSILPRNPRRRNAQLALALAAMSALAGCAVAPLPHLPDETPARWQQAEVAAPAAAVDLRGWWKAFNDPQLDRLVEAALNDNLSIAQAGLRIESARALDQHHQAAFLPQFGFRTYAEPTPDSSASYFQAGFDAKWEFGLFGRSQSGARVSAGDLGIAEAEAQAARVSVVAEVVRSYVELRAAQRRRVLLARLSEAAQTRRALTATRESLRLASATDVANANAQAGAAQAALAGPDAEIVRARRQLSALLGRNGAADGIALDPAAPMPDVSAIAIDTLPADLVRTRPEIRRAEFDVLKKAGELGLAHADRFPRVGLGGALTYASKVIGHTRLSDAAGLVTFGPAIEIPLFDWGARHAVEQARDADLKASLLAYRQAVLDGIAEVESALAALHAQAERVALLARNVAALDEALKGAGTLQRLGLADRTDLVAATAAKVDGEIALAQARQERSLAFIALYKALGGAPLPPPPPPPEHAP